MEKDKVDIELIKQYIHGELSPREMYMLERRAQDDPMLMDVILGMEQEAQGGHEAHLTDIRQRIASRTGRGHTRRLASVQRWAVAASVLLVLTAAALWFTQQDGADPEQSIAASVPSGAEAQRPERRTTPETNDATKGAATDKQEPSSAASAMKEQADRASRQLTSAAEETETTDNIQPTKTRAVSIPGNKVFDTIEEVRIAAYAPQAKKSADIPAVQLEQPLNARASALRVPSTSRIQQPWYRTVTGQVVDQETQAPLPGVVLQLANAHTAVSDSQGRFILADSSHMLTASAIGYESQMVVVADLDSLTIGLQPTVVHDNRSNLATAQPEPENGWRAFLRYLRQGTAQSGGLKGTVALTFTIDDKGVPTQIQVVHTDDARLNDHAIQLVRKGAKWKPGKNGERKVELQVSF